MNMVSGPLWWRALGTGPLLHPKSGAGRTFMYRSNLDTLKVLWVYTLVYAIIK